MSEIVAREDCLDDIDHLIETEAFPTDTINFEDKVWRFVYHLKDNGGETVYRSKYYRFVITQAEPQLYEI